MGKLTLNNVDSGYASTSAVNANNDLTEAAVENTLSRDGTTPNQMGADLDLNSYNILNQGNPITVEGFIWEGLWVTATAYTVGDAVQESGSAYICIEDHTSGTFATDLAALKWQLLANTSLPSQTGNAGKYLTTDATTPSWRALHFVDAKNEAFNATGDGVTDDTTALQSWATDAAKIKVLPPGNYLVTGTITFLADSTVHAHGARIFDTATHRTLIDCSNGDITIHGLEVEGKGNSSYNASGIGIYCIGTNNDPSAPTYVVAPKLVDCYIHDLGAYGVRLIYAEDGGIYRSRIEDVGYAGVGAASSRRIGVESSHIKGITPGTSSTCYNIFFSRSSSDADTTVEPRCVDCYVDGCVIEDNTIYEGLDTHGGENIRFLNCVIKNVAKAINIGFSEVSGTAVLGPLQCGASNIIIDTSLNTKTNIIVLGKQADGIYADRCYLDNILVKGGGSDATTSAGIKLESTRWFKGCNINCHQNMPHGIIITSNNLHFMLSNVQAKDPYSDTVNYPAAVAVTGNTNTGKIGTVNIDRQNAGLGTDVAEYSIHVASGLTGLDIEAERPTVDASTNGINNPSNLIHVEKLVQSGNETPTVSTGAAFDETAVTFPKAFAAAPNITLGSNREAGGSVSIEVLVKDSTKTTTGFTLRLETADGSNFSSAFVFDVDWVASGV